MDQQDPWWRVLPPDHILGRAAASPGKWLGHVPFALWPQHGQTSGAIEMGGGTQEVPTSDIHLGSHWHADASPPLLQRYLSPVLPSWQLLFWLYDLHI